MATEQTQKAPASGYCVVWRTVSSWRPFCRRIPHRKTDREVISHVSHFPYVYPERNAYLNRTSKSPYTISVPQQVALCVRRGFQRIRGEMAFSLVTVFGMVLISLILGSVFYDLPNNTASLNNRCILLFFALLFNALNSSLEVVQTNP